MNKIQAKLWRTGMGLLLSATLGVALGAAPESDSTSAARMGTWGFDVSGMDTSVRPGDDFNGFANGSWMQRSVIPADRSRFGAFDELRELSDLRVRKLLEAMSKIEKPTADQAKLAALFASYMNTDEIEKRDAAPVMPMIDEIRAIPDKHAFTAWMGKAAGGLGGSVVGAFVSDDAKNPQVYALYMGQSGLGLPDRDYYLKENFAEKKAKYQAYLAQMLGMVNWANPEEAAAKVVEFETRLATVHWSRAQGRDRDKTYNPMAVKELDTYAPGIEWQVLLDAARVGSAERVILTQNTAIPAIAKIYSEADLDTLKAWEAAKVIDEAAPLLSKRFSDAAFEFRTKYLSGVPEQRDRVKRATAFAQSSMGEAVGREYVALYFPPESKAKMEALVANVQAAFKARIDNLTWMTPETKVKAQEKLSKFRVKIGYPTKWRDYTAIDARPDDLFGNSIRARKFAYDYRVSKLGQKVDRAEWSMTPQTVNAYYSSTGNEIVFPAAILQPPFFDPDADPAINYGGIGGVIGHELTHGFDDQGRKSDGDGVLRDWWTLEDSQKFEAQAFKLGTQYESYEFKKSPNFRIVAKLTMGENIADLGGILLALDAYKLSLNGAPAPIIDGFTGNQRVFLGWAQVWRSLQRDAALQQQLTTDSHSPSMIRAFAPLRNVNAWYESFGVKEGEKEYLKPEDRVRIW